MDILKSNIKFTIDLYKNEGITDFATDIFPPHFLMTICGKPGSGKTTLLKFLLQSDKFFFKKFDYVFIISPSALEYESLFLPATNYSKKLDWNWINSKLMPLQNNPTYFNILFILDDVISDLYTNRYSKDIMDFIFNRRHLLKGKGMISMVLTSQKFTRIPTEIRSCSNLIIFFKLNNICFKKMYEDIIFADKDKFDLILKLFSKEEQIFVIYRIDNNKFYKKFDQIKFK